MRVGRSPALAVLSQPCGLDLLLLLRKDLPDEDFFLPLLRILLGAAKLPLLSLYNERRIEG